MGLISSFLKLVIKYGVPLLIGAVVLLNTTVWLASPLALNPSMPIVLRYIGVIVPPSCIVGSLVLYKMKKDLRVFIGIPLAVAVPWVMLVVSWLFLIPQFILSLGPIEIVSVVILPLSALTFAVYHLFEDKISFWTNEEVPESEKIPERETEASFAIQNALLIGGFQVIGSPQERVQPEGREDIQKIWQLTASILRTLMTDGAPLIYRFQRIMGVSEEYYLTLGRSHQELEKNMNILGGALSGNIPEYRVERKLRFSMPTIEDDVSGVVVCLTGEPLSAEDPRQREDPLTVPAKAMLHYNNAVMQISAVPVSSGLFRSLRRIWLNTKVKSHSSQAQMTRTEEKGGILSKGQEAIVHYDPIASEKAREAGRELDRYKAKFACNVEVAFASWGPQAPTEAQLLMQLLRGAITPAKPSQDFKVHLKNNRSELLQLVEGKPIGLTTLLLPVEAAHLVTLPQTDIETPITKRSSFSTYTEPLPETQQPARRTPDPLDALIPIATGLVPWTKPAMNMVDKAVIGNPLRLSGSPILTRVETFRRRLFHSHLLICGNTRSGKSYTAFSLTAQAMRWGMKATIIVPRRPDDWLDLLSIRKDIWVFTPGDPDTAPLRINISIPPDNVPLELWMETVVQILSGLLPSDRVMSLHFDEIVDAAYRKCGWNAKKKIQGRPILLSDLWDAVEEIASTLDYGNELRANFYGALTSRMRRMLRKHILVDMYNTEEGITWEQIANNNIIFDLSRLPKDDRAFLMGLLTSGLHMYKSFNRTKEMTNLLVLEEASYILKPTKIQDLYGPDATQTLLYKIVDMFTTGGGNGLASMAVEQLAGRIAPEIVKLIVNVIAHAISDGPERDLIADKLGLEEEKRGHLQQMDTGETLVFLESSKVVKNIQVWPIDNMLVGRLPRKGLSAEQIRKHMESVYQAHPNLQNTIDLPTNIIARLERAAPIGIPPEGQTSPRTESTVYQPLRETTAVKHDERIKRFMTRPHYVETLELAAESAEAGDIGPLTDLVIMVSRDLAGRTLDQAWVAGRIVAHTVEVYPDLMTQERADLILSRVNQLLKGG